MSDEKVYPVKKEIAENAHITAESYQTLYQQSISDPESFWSEQANQFLDWSKLGILLWHLIIQKVKSAGLKEES